MLEQRPEEFDSHMCWDHLLPLYATAVGSKIGIEE